MEIETTEPTVKRRDFLKLAWGLLAGVVTVELGALTMAYMQPRLAEGEFGSLISVGSVEDFPPGSVTHVPNGRFYLSRLADGGFLAISQRCTHLGCNVPWEQAANAFVCPCHNSQFSADGNLLSPPAPRALDLFPVSIEEGMVKVDTSKPIARQQFEAEQVVYP